MGGIANFLIWEVVCTEYLRTKNRIANSNEEADHVVAYQTKDGQRPTDDSDRGTVLRQLFRWAILPSNGDAVVYFMIPVVLINWFVVPQEVGRWIIGVVDVYFIYLCITNFSVTILSIGRVVLRKKVEGVYAQFVSGGKMSQSRS